MTMRKYFLLLSVPLALAAAAHGDPAPCCFTNQAYSGVCEVTPAKDETCADVLSYLNNPQSSGKSYCGGTNIRGGWESAACKTGY